jgi:hypothetical protein
MQRIAFPIIGDCLSLALGKGTRFAQTKFILERWLRRDYWNSRVSIGRSSPSIGKLAKGYLALDRAR